VILKFKNPQKIHHDEELLTYNRKSTQTVSILFDGWFQVSAQSRPKMNMYNMGNGQIPRPRSLVRDCTSPTCLKVPNSESAHHSAHYRSPYSMVRPERHVRASSRTIQLIGTVKKWNFALPFSTIVVGRRPAPRQATIARHSTALHGKPRHGKPPQTTASHGKRRQATANDGKPRQAMANHGKLWQGKSRQTTANHSKPRQATACRGNDKPHGPPQSTWIAEQIVHQESTRFHWSK
jgi:hypothetical protein